ncbi:MAG TPA: hypothetical protein VH599_05775 [Ktedonobacterales bacterium]
MNQDPDDLSLNNPPNERGSDPASSHRFPQPSRQGQPQPPPQPSGAFPSPQDERLARLRALREQRQQFGAGPIPPADFQRRGLPTPPPAQPPVQELLKHWWHHGPFSGRLPSVNPTDPQAEKKETRPATPPLPTTATPYEERAKEWIAQGRKGLSIASAKAQEMMNQAKDLLNQKMQSQPKPSNAEEIVPGLIIVGFAPTVSMEEAVKEIGALGGKPLRHKAALNLYQVAVPPGQEQALIQRFRQQPGVISADLEHARPPR